MSNTLKVQAFIAQHGYCSRRKAEALIAEGQVMVNNQPAHIGQRIDPNLDTVEVEGHRLNNLELTKVYYLVNKPVGVVSTTSDELGRKNVTQLIPQTAHRVYPVGRLDTDSEGLILLTNDGELTHRLTHPSSHVPKTYHVLVAGRPTAAALRHLDRGVKLDGRYCAPDELNILGHEDGNTWLELTIHEGQNRQVRRMLQRVGYETIKLIRVSIGPFSLEELGNHVYKSLTANEVIQRLEQSMNFPD